MFEKDQFELIDFGNGRKLEKFAGVHVVRDCPAADGTSAKQNLESTLRDQSCIQFDKRETRWTNKGDVPEHWQIHHRDVVFNLKMTPFGHLGVFCEQAENWDWILDLPIELSGRRGLNLFAYTGGSTLALARRNVAAVHLDAAKNIVSWARKNALSSGLEDSPIRWIVDDAAKFVRREIKRGNRYDVIVVDPPAIGHSGNKMTWKFDRDIADLMSGLAQIASDNFLALLLTCHTEGYDSAALFDLANQYFELESGRSESGAMDLVCSDGRRLNCGHFFRWYRPT